MGGHYTKKILDLSPEPKKDRIPLTRSDRSFLKRHAVEIKQRGLTSEQALAYRNLGRNLDGKIKKEK